MSAALRYRLLLAWVVFETAVLAPVWLVLSLVRDWLADAPSAIEERRDGRRFA